MGAWSCVVLGLALCSLAIADNDDRKLQLSVLHDTNIFADPRIINQYYAVVGKPIIVDHVVSMPAFKFFVDHALGQLKFADEAERADFVKDAVDQAFDLLLKQYSRLPAEFDVDDLEKSTTAPDTKRRRKRAHTPQLSDLFSEKFLRKLVRVSKRNILNAAERMSKKQGVEMPTRRRRSATEKASERSDIRKMTALFAAVKNAVDEAVLASPTVDRRRRAVPEEVHANIAKRSVEVVQQLFERQGVRGLWNFIVDEICGDEVNCASERLKRAVDTYWPEKQDERSDLRDAETEEHRSRATRHIAKREAVGDDSDKELHIRVRRF